MDGYGGWYEDFWRLSTERQIGFGIGPIPASAIEKHVAGWSYEDAEIFEFCMRQMDGLYLMRNNSPENAQPAQPPMSAMEQMAQFDRVFGKR